MDEILGTHRRIGGEWDPEIGWDGQIQLADYPDAFRLPQTGTCGATPAGHHHGLSQGSFL
jgi:hypothetical protein